MSMAIVPGGAKQPHHRLALRDFGILSNPKRPKKRFIVPGGVGPPSRPCEGRVIPLHYGTGTLYTKSRPKTLIKGVDVVGKAHED